MNRCLLVVVFALVGTIANAQETANPRELFPAGGNINLAGPTLIASASMDYFVVPIWSVEGGVGAIGYFLGTKYYPTGNQNVKFTPYAGITVTAIEPLFGGKTRTHVYFPIGVQHWGSKRFTFAIEAAYFKSNAPFEEDRLYGSFRVGWRFN